MDISRRIRKANKGGTTVILDQSTHKNKMQTLLQDSVMYKGLCTDPTPSLQRRMNNLLLKLEREGESYIIICVVH